MMLGDKAGQSTSWLMLLAAAMVLGGLWPEAIFGCGGNDVTDVDIWIGSTQIDAEFYNTTDFWKCAGETFGWFVGWDADEPDDEDFYGELHAGTTEVDTFTADEDERDDSGTATLPSSMAGGLYTVMVCMHREGGEWECDTAAAQIKLVEVELECVGHPAGFTLLPDKRLCSNAQPEYGKTKWRAKKVRPSGTTATVTASGPVSLTGIGCSLTALSEGDEFWVQAAAGGSTSYQLTLTQNDYGNCSHTDGDSVFKFKFDWPKVNSSSGIGGGGSVDEDAGSVDASKTEAPPAAGVQNAGYVRWRYEVKVVTEPSGSYSGNVEAKASITFETDGQMQITNYAPPLNWEGASIGVNFVIITVNVPFQSGWTNYGSSIAGADTSIQMATQPEVQLGDAKHDYLEVGFPIVMPTKSKTWDVDLNQTENDETRTWAVASTTHDLYCKVAGGSNLSLFKYWLCVNISTWVSINDQSIDSVEVEEFNGVFDLVP